MLSKVWHTFLVLKVIESYPPEVFRGDTPRYIGLIVRRGGGSYGSGLTYRSRPSSHMIISKSHVCTCKISLFIKFQKYLAVSYSLQLGVGLPRCQSFDLTQWAYVACSSSIFYPKHFFVTLK